MESEKVKEIKKALECCTNPVYCQKECPYHIYERHLECINELSKDALTLINELEHENERIKNIGLNEDITVREWLQENQELKDRIAELEKENEELKQDLKKSIDMQKEMLDGFKTATKEVEENLARGIPNLLKQFAERLKEQIKATAEWYDDRVYKCYNGIMEKDIDETLKEFLKK